MLRMIVVALVCLSFCAGSARADGVSWPLDALTGLEAVDVEVNPISTDASRDGLRTTTLQADIEKRVRQVGLRIVTQRIRQVPHMGFLRLTVDAVPSESDQGASYEYQMRLELHQEVAIEDNPAVRATAVTWRTSTAAILWTNSLVRSVRCSLQTMLDRFVEDLVSADNGLVRPCPHRPTAVSEAVSAPEG